MQQMKLPAADFVKKKRHSFHPGLSESLRSPGFFNDQFLSFFLNLVLFVKFKASLEKKK
jgi:hypothetical protein